MQFESISVGDKLEQTIEDLRGEDMKLVAALLQDPYPPHYDPRRAEELGYPGLLNQGPANLAYVLQPIVRQLDAPSDIERFDTRFHDMVFEGETATATATVKKKEPNDDGGGLVEFSVTLTKGNDETAVDGTVSAIFDV
jgi:acyl dehydratase